MVFLYKLLYINILSFLLHLFFVIWEDGKMGKWEFWKKCPLFSLSLAISLRYVFAMSHVIVFAGFTRTELLSLP